MSNSIRQKIRTALRPAFISSLLLSIAILFSSESTRAWENHALPTFFALSGMKEIQSAPPVVAEALEAFLTKSDLTALADVLAHEEQWAILNVKNYPFCPAALQFQKSSSPTELRAHFLGAIRANPHLKLALYRQKIPGEVASVSQPRSADLPARDVSLLPDLINASEIQFAPIQEGSQIPVIDVVTSASNEPDFGLDIGLWEDNGTDFGAAYGFGKQPFGNPTLSFSSQAPFHMGFFHESAIVYKLADYLAHTYPEFRIHLFMSLARFSFAQGHPYWGWRFLGWSLHYVQDLTQPYHSTVLPGVSLPRMILLSALDLLGFHNPKNNNIQLVTNRHLALENYQYEVFRKLILNPGQDHPVLNALRTDASSVATQTYADSNVRNGVTAASHALADKTNRILGASVPDKFVNDPGYLFGITESHVDMLKEVERDAKSTQAEMRDLLAELMKSFGVYSRGYIQTTLRQ
jgi:hypothetical protein